MSNKRLDSMEERTRNDQVILVEEEEENMLAISPAYNGGQNGFTNK